MRKVAILGIGQTKVDEHWDKSLRELGGEAAFLAMQDAGVDKVDALYVGNMLSPMVSGQNQLGAFFGDWIGLWKQEAVKIEAACGSGAAAFRSALMAVASGDVESALVVGVEKMTDKAGRDVTAALATAADADYEVEQGVSFVGINALVMRRYMHEYGATREHLCNVATAVRGMANRNPAAVMHGKRMTRDDYMAARWISEPLCLFDNCLETDGALACVVVSAERARDCRQRPALVHAFGQGMGAQSHAMTNYWCADPLRGPGHACAEQLYRHSDVRPRDIACAQLYDAFTPLVLFSLEAYGFCARGEGAAFTEDGGLELGGRLPVNTSGGGLSEAYVHGFNLVLEGVRQIRGTSTSQVEGCAATLVTAGECVPTSALILRRD